jgi:hypothetical protein
MSDANELRCQCLDPECSVDAFHETDIGSDSTAGSFSNVSLFDCRFCGRRWLYCSINEEVFSRPSRWYRGPISVTRSRSIRPEYAAEILASLSWYFHGGSDVETNGQKSSGPVSLDLEVDETEAVL